MRKLILFALILIGCQKATIKPEIITPKLGVTTPQSFTQIPISAVNIQLYTGTFKIDGTMIQFKPTAQTTYIKNEDAIYFFSPYSIANFTSVSSDGWPLAINTRPYKQNDTIPLRIYSRQSGNYRFKVTSYNAPYKMCILDNGWKCNLDSGFTVDIADSSTFYNRFKFIVK